MNLSHVMDTSLDILLKSMFVLVPFWITKGIVLMNRKDKPIADIDSKHKMKEWIQTIATVAVITAFLFFVPLDEDGVKGDMSTEKGISLFIVILTGALYGLYSANVLFKRQVKDKYIEA